MHKRILLLGVAFLLLFSGQAFAAGEIKVGSINDLTGATSDVGKDMALAQIINSQRKVGDEFLPLLVKGDLREFDQQLPYLHLHRLQLAKLPLLSNFEREDIRQSITRKLLLLYRQADSLCLQPANPR